MMEGHTNGVISNQKLSSPNEQQASKEKEGSPSSLNLQSESSSAGSNKPETTGSVQINGAKPSAAGPPTDKKDAEPKQDTTKTSKETGASKENNGTSKSAKSALLEAVKPATTKKEVKPRPALVRKDTFSRLNEEKDAKSNLILPVVRDEYDKDGWYIYRGNGEIHNKEVTRVKVVSDAVSGGGITQIPDKAFYGCSKLTTVLIENDAITTVGQFAFYECTKLAEIHLPTDITTIGEYAFSGCSTLTTLQLPQALTAIDEGTFSDCPSLTSVLLPDKMKSIGLYAFYGCRSLTNILLPPKVRSVGEEAFEGCEALLALCDPGLTLIEWLRLRYFNLPLHRLCYLPGITDLEVLVFKKQIDIVDGSKMNPLHILALNPSAALDTNCTLDMINSMLSNSTNKLQLISAKDQQGRTPVHYACLNPYVTLAMIVAMVDNCPKACLSTEDKQKKYPTTLAIDFHRPVEIQQWLYRYQPVEAKDLRFNNVESEKLVRDLAANFISDLIKKGSDIGVKFPAEEQHGWVQFASQLKEDDLVQNLVDFISSCDRASAKALANAQDYQRRSAISVAVKGIREALQASMLFCGRFDMELRPRYETNSSLVYFAVDMKSGEAQEVPVAIKFFFDKGDFDAEKRIRLKNPDDVFSSRLGSDYVIRLLSMYDGDSDKVAQAEATKFDVPPYFLVMEQGDRNLFESINGENLGSRPASVCTALYELALSLRHLHTAGYIHGDLNSRNVVRQAKSRRWCLIDLDNALGIGMKMTSVRIGTAYMPPEMLKMENKDPVLLSITAHPSFDVWSYGVIMYQMVSEKTHLFDGIDIYDNLDKAGLKKLANWDYGDIKDKLSNLRGPAKDLLSKIFTKKQDKRPTMDEILQDSFFAPYLRLTQLKMTMNKAESEGKNYLAVEIKREIDDVNKDLNDLFHGTYGKRNYFQDLFFRGGCPSPPNYKRRPSTGGASTWIVGGGVPGDISIVSDASNRRPQPPQAKKTVPRISRRASTGGSATPDYSWTGTKQGFFKRPSIGFGGSPQNSSPSGKLDKAPDNNNSPATTTKTTTSTSALSTSSHDSRDRDLEPSSKRRGRRSRRKSVF